METTEVYDGVRAHALLHASIDYESYTLTIDPRQLCGVLLILLTFQIKSLGLVRYLKCASTASQTSTELISMVIKSSELSKYCNVTAWYSSNENRDTHSCIPITVTWSEGVLFPISLSVKQHKNAYCNLLNLNKINCLLVSTVVSYVVTFNGKRRYKACAVYLSTLAGNTLKQVVYIYVRSWCVFFYFILRYS